MGTKAYSIDPNGNVVFTCTTGTLRSAEANFTGAANDFVGTTTYNKGQNLGTAHSTVMQTADISFANTTGLNNGLVNLNAANNTRERY